MAFKDTILTLEADSARKRGPEVRGKVFDANVDSVQSIWERPDRYKIKRKKSKTISHRRICRSKVNDGRHKDEYDDCKNKRWDDGNHKRDYIAEATTETVINNGTKITEATQYATNSRTVAISNFVDDIEFCRVCKQGTNVATRTF